MIVEFSMLGVPKNWDNYMKNRFVLYEEKKEWLNSTIILGRVARVKAGISVATKEGAKRTVIIHQRRRGILDKGGLYNSCKPIIDGLKSSLRKKVDGRFIRYEGAGLIFDDDPSHIDWEVTQEKTTEETKITITVEIEETERV